MKLDLLVGKVYPEGPRLVAGDFEFKQRTRCLQHSRPTVLPPCWPCSSVSGTVRLQPWTALMMSRSFVWDPGEGQMLNLLPVTIHTRLCVCVVGVLAPLSRRQKC